MRSHPALVLVAYGSPDTCEIAHEIMEELVEAGVDAEVAPLDHVTVLSGYDGVIVGGCTRRFARQHARKLHELPVWVFATRPRLVDRVSARGYATFARSGPSVKRWAREIAEALDREPDRVAIATPTPPRQRHLLAAACLFVGITAIGGGAALVARPDGSLIQAPAGMLAHSPFDTFLVPGLLLLVVVGIGNAIAGYLIARDKPGAPFAALFAGASLFAWIVTEMILLREHHWLQLGYLAVAALILLETRKTFANRLSAAWHTLAH